MIILLILIDFADDSLWISLGENRFWALLGLKGLRVNCLCQFFLNRAVTHTSHLWPVFCTCLSTIDKSNDFGGQGLNSHNWKTWTYTWRVTRAVTKGQGARGFPPARMNMSPSYFIWTQKEKKNNELPSCLLLFPVYTVNQRNLFLP